MGTGTLPSRRCELWRGSPSSQAIQLRHRYYEKQNCFVSIPFQGLNDRLSIQMHIIYISLDFLHKSWLNIRLVGCLYHERL